MASPLTAKIESALKDFRSNKDRVSVAHPDWDQNRDVRVAAFGKCLNVLESTRLATWHLEENVSLSSWWEQVAPGQGVDDAYILRAHRELNIFCEVACIQLLFSAVESSLRVIFRELDPVACNRGVDNFKNVYECLFARLGMQSHGSLLLLLSYVRNTVHNNGVFFHKSHANQSVIHGGREYKFEIGKLIDFVSWDLVINLAGEVNSMLYELVNHPMVAGCAVIRDPSHS